jgi:hypothetical protein
MIRFDNHQLVRSRTREGTVKVVFGISEAPAGFVPLATLLTPPLVSIYRIEENLAKTLRHHRKVLLFVSRTDSVWGLHTRTVSSNTLDKGHCCWNVLSCTRVYVLGSRGEEKWWWVNGRRSVQEPTANAFFIIK